jgi:hypothetical protein
LFCNDIDFLGHQISHCGIEADLQRWNTSFPGPAPPLLPKCGNSLDLSNISNNFSHTLLNTLLSFTPSPASYTTSDCLCGLNVMRRPSNKSRSSL